MKLAAAIAIVALACGPQFLPYHGPAKLPELQQDPQLQSQQRIGDPAYSGVIFWRLTISNPLAKPIHVVVQCQFWSTWELDIPEHTVFPFIADGVYDAEGPCRLLRWSTLAVVEP